MERDPVSGWETGLSPEESKPGSKVYLSSEGENSSHAFVGHGFCCGNHNCGYYQRHECGDDAFAVATTCARITTKSSP